MYSVSSAYLVEAAKTNAAWKRRFLIGTSDYSAWVKKWPNIKREWNDIKPGTVTINLVNGDQAFNFFIQDPTKLRSDCSIQLGFDYTPSSSEYLTLFSGKVDATRYSNGDCSITLVDKFKQLADRTVGDNTSPVFYTSSSFLVHDLAWYLVTSHGGYSAVRSTSNPDIDWTSFNSWSSVFSADNTRLKAQFKGKKITEMLKRISELTQSAIWIENNRIKFFRFGIADMPATGLDDDTIADVSLTFDDRRIINRALVSANYDVTSKLFPITVANVSTSSINSYSVRESQTAYEDIWHVDSVSAINLAQRLVLSYAEPQGSLQVESSLAGIVATIGDTVTFDDGFLGLQSSYRMMSEDIDMDIGKKTFTIDETQILASFRLDFSTLDGTDVLA